MLTTMFKRKEFVFKRCRGVYYARRRISNVYLFIVVYELFVFSYDIKIILQDIMIQVGSFLFKEEESMLELLLNIDVDDSAMLMVEDLK